MEILDLEKILIIYLDLVITVIAVDKFSVQ